MQSNPHSSPLKGVEPVTEAKVGTGEMLDKPISTNLWTYSVNYISIQMYNTNMYHGFSVLFIIICYTEITLVTS